MREGRLGVMRKALMRGAVLGMLLWSGTPYAHGQEATEMFIPVGQSPGLSGKVTVIGSIQSVSPADRTIAIAGSSGGSWSAQVTDRTQIWLDRSKLRLQNRLGSFADLERGRLVEIRYEDNERKGPARWVKVQLTQ